MTYPTVWCSTETASASPNSNTANKARFATSNSDLCTGLNANKSLKLTFLVVGKRHHTRYYATNEADTCITPQERAIKPPHEWNSNLKPGLYVDRVVTDPGVRFNFFLQSHLAIQGTARSAHYHVLVDEIGFGNGLDLPNLTHSLCYAFGRATRGVSYVALAYIADRMCERGRVYLRSWNRDSEGFGDPVTLVGEKAKEKEDIIAWRQRMAEELMRDRNVWGPNYNDDPAKGTVRLNPWHPNLDKTMFWM